VSGTRRGASPTLNDMGMVQFETRPSLIIYVFIAHMIQSSIETTTII